LPRLRSLLTREANLPPSPRCNQQALNYCLASLFTGRKRKTTQSRPMGSHCVVKFHLEDGGVVLRIQLMIGAAWSIELLGQYSITDRKRKSRGLYRSCIAIFNQ
jgi:hypothetical protein